MNRGIFIFATIVLLCLCIILMITTDKIPILTPKRFQPYITMNPYALRSAFNYTTKYNQTYFKNLMNISKNLGFKGIGVYGLEGFTDENALAEFLTDTQNYGFEALIFINWCDRIYKANQSETWNVTGFPDNATQVNAFLDYVQNITLTAKNFYCVKGYVLQYPYWSNLTHWRCYIANSSSYYNNLQAIINKIKENDPHRLLYLSSDMVERHFGGFKWSKLPYNFTNVDGFGFSCYSENPDTYTKTLKEYYQFFKEKSNQYAKGYIVFSEWGFKTNPYAITSEGLVLNEKAKCEMIIKTLNTVKGWNAPVCYFMIHDFKWENDADWGLVTDDLQLRDSARTFQNYLNTEHKIWYENPLTFGVVIFLIIHWHQIYDLKICMISS